MAEYTALAPLFTDIADAIRSKTGETGKIAANNFPTQINTIKTNQIKVIQVSSSGGEYADINTFSFPTEFTPTGFMRIANDIIYFSSKNNVYEISATSSLKDYITSFIYLDSKFYALSARASASKQGTSTLFYFLTYTLASNFDQSYNKKTHEVAINSDAVDITPVSSKLKTYFVQGQNKENHWTIIYWN